MYDNKWVTFSVFIVIGFIVCFFGRKLYKPVFFIAGCLATVFIILLIFYSTFLTSNTENWVGWTVIACSILLGLLVGFIFMKVSKLGAFFLAAWGGFSLGLLIWNTFLYLAGYSNALFWCFCLGCGLILGLLALCFFDHIIINCTAMAGAYMFVYAIGLVAGGYQNPFTIADEYEEGMTIDPIFYAYMVGTVVMFIIGDIVQYKMKATETEFQHPYYKYQ